MPTGSETTRERLAEDEVALVTGTDPDYFDIQSLKALAFSRNSTAYVDFSNEVNLKATALFGHGGRPYLQSNWADVLRKRFGALTYPGDEDSGAMSSTYFFVTAGFFPSATEDTYYLSGPRVPRLEFNVGGGKTFTVTADNAGGQNVYVRSATLNGEPLTTPVIRHSDITAGSTLAFVMGPNPTTWGTGQDFQTPARRDLTLPVSGQWRASLGTPAISDPASASPVWGNGPDGADNSAIHSEFPDLTLTQPGDEITLTATVAFSGLTSPLGSPSARFAWGLFNDSGSGGTAWPGYLASNDTTDIAGTRSLWKKPAGGSQPYHLATGGSALSSFSLVTPDFADGTYRLVMTLSRNANGSLDHYAALVRASDGVLFAAFTGSDTAPATFTFNRVGFRASDALNADSIAITDFAVVANGPSSNTLPSVTLTSPAEGATYDAPATVLLTATASDPDGTIAKVEFFSGAEKLGEDTTEPFEFTWNRALTGNHTITAKAIDNGGSAGVSAPVNIVIANEDNVPPTVGITAPSHGQTIITNSLTITADAADEDGVVTKVEFYNGATRLGEATSAPFSYVWTGVPTGTHSLTVVATDNDTATTVSSPVVVNVTEPVTTSVVSRGAVWKYLDNGSNAGTAWKEPAFDDSTWPSGPAVLGGGDSHITTSVNLGPSGSRHITTYLRRTFEVTEASSVRTLLMNILRDDGVVVYINGTEVTRQNMPAGAVDHLTQALETVGGLDETTYFPATISQLPGLVDGTNVIAVELHQRDSASSDLGFDLEMTALSLPVLPVVTISATDATAGEFGDDATLSFTVTRTGSSAAKLDVPLVASGSATEGSDYTGFSSSLEIPSGQSSATLVMTVQPDNEAEGTETVNVTLGTSTQFNAGTPATASGTISDKPDQSFYFEHIADPLKRGPQDDADNDSTANIIEYFMGTLPGDANSRAALEIPVVGNGSFTIRYPRAKNRSGVQGSLRWSADLGAWHAGGESASGVSVSFSETVTSPPEADPETVEVTGTVSGGSPTTKVFVRLVVE